MSYTESQEGHSHTTTNYRINVSAFGRMNSTIGHEKEVARKASSNDSLPIETNLSDITRNRKRRIHRHHHGCWI